MKQIKKKGLKKIKEKNEELINIFGAANKASKNKKNILYWGIIQSIVL